MNKDIHSKPVAGREATAAAPAPKTQEAPEYWRRFPQTESMLRAERPSLLEDIERTCRQLDAIIKTGTPPERERAQAALTAYAHSLELYRAMCEYRDQAGSRK